MKKIKRLSLNSSIICYICLLLLYTNSIIEINIISIIN